MSMRGQKLPVGRVFRRTYTAPSSPRRSTSPFRSLHSFSLSLSFSLSFFFRACAAVWVAAYGRCGRSDVLSKRAPSAIREDAGRIDGCESRVFAVCGNTRIKRDKVVAVYLVYSVVGVMFLSVAALPGMRGGSLFLAARAQNVYANAKIFLFLRSAKPL